MNHALQFKALKYRMFWSQTLITLILAVAGFYQDLYLSLSILMGGLISIFPNFVFSSFYPLKSPHLQAKSIVKRLYWAETVKLLVITLLFVFAFQWSNLKVVYVFINFILMQFVFVVLSLVHSR